jgi:hypothetical protein
MTITFESKHNDEIIKVDDVKYFTADSTCLGVTGFSVHYNDGTFNLYSNRTWKLIMVKA